MDLLEFIILDAMIDDGECVESIKPNFETLYSVTCTSETIVAMLKSLFEKKYIFVVFPKDAKEIDFNEDWFELTPKGYRRMKWLSLRLKKTITLLEEAKAMQMMELSKPDL